MSGSPLRKHGSNVSSMASWIAGLVVGFVCAVLLWWLIPGLSSMPVQRGQLNGWQCVGVGFGFGCGAAFLFSLMNTLVGWIDGLVSSSSGKGPATAK